MKVIKGALFTFSLLLVQMAIGQYPAVIKGKILNLKGEAVPSATISIQHSGIGYQADENGNYRIPLGSGVYLITVTSVGYDSQTEKVKLEEGQVLERNFILSELHNDLDEVEVFGQRNRQPEKLDAITRMPLRPSDQIQSISVISDRLIEKQGALTVIEGVRNIPGVYTYATYGGVKESISSRGFRGIPTLKNGVRVMTDFRGSGFPTDMQGVENIQVMKGSAAVTQGLGQASGQATDLGAPGGLVNIVTKTPKFINAGTVSLRAGSFELFRPTFDVQQVLDKEGKVAFRIDGSYQYGGKYRKGMQKESFYLNPSLAFRPDELTSIYLEMDFYNVNENMDAGTVNTSVMLNPDFDPAQPVSNRNPKYVTNRTNEIYDLPTNRYLGFKTDISSVTHSTYAVRYQRYMNEKKNIYIRAALYRSVFDNDAIRTTLNALPSADGVNDTRVHLFTRTIGKNSPRLDKNTVVQVDFVGKDIFTGAIKHTFMAGMDYKFTNLTEYTYNTIAIPGVIDIFDPSTVSNALPYGTASFSKTGENISKTTNMGATVQDVVELSERLKIYGAIRFSTNQSSSPLNSAFNRTSFFNPLAGIMFTVKKGLNVFASYTNSTKPENVNQVDEQGNTFGNSYVNQLEAGVKSDWLNNRLRFNLTLYKIEQRNLIEQLYDINNQPIQVEGRNVYRAGGNDRRQGVEVEIAGRVTNNFEIITGYSFVDAQFIKTSVYVEGSAPNNTPKHTYNAWANYTFTTGTLKGLNIGAGLYHIGERPYNDWTQEGYTTHGLDTSKEPWKNKAYTIVNAQAGYDINDHWSVRLFVNNVLDAVGYDAYRTTFIDRIAPRSFSGMIQYRF